jgi:MoxR-like ATPase
MARSVDSDFHRLRFTSDMLPSDVLGVTIYNAQRALNLNLDLFSRTSCWPMRLIAPLPRRGAAQAMNEGQVTIDELLPLAQPFMVITTQNPVDTEPIRCPSHSSTGS